jgi:tetratricopeptide (TPR) repeat protein
MHSARPFFALLLGAVLLSGADSSIPTIADELRRAQDTERQGNPEGAEAIYLKAEARLTEETVPPAVRATLLHNFASLLQNVGRNQDAEWRYQEALKVWRAAAPGSRASAWVSLSNLVSLHVAQHRYDRARRVLDQWPASDAKDGEVPHRLLLLSGIAMNEGPVSAAEPLLRDAVLALEATPKPDGWLAGTIHNNLGLVCMNLGKYSDAAKHLAVAEQTFSAGGLAHRLLHARSLANLGELAMLAGDAAASAAHYQKSLSMLQERLGQDHRTIHEVCLGYVKTLRALGRNKEAKNLEKRSRMALADVAKVEGRVNSVSYSTLLRK